MAKKIKKIPYGIADFEKIQSKGFYYVDKTRFIPLIESAGEYLFSPTQAIRQVPVAFSYRKLLRSGQKRPFP